MKSGFVKLPRGAFKGPIWDNPDLWKLYCLCLEKAAWKPYSVHLEGLTRPIEVGIGQFVTGRDSLHRDYYTSKRRKKEQKSPQTLQRWLKILSEMGLLELKMNNRFTLVTLLNTAKDAELEEEEGQDEQQFEQQMNNSRTTDEQQMNTVKESIKKIEDGKRRSKNGRNVETAKRVLAHLNAVTGKKPGRGFRDHAHVLARLNEGATEDECMFVIKNKKLDPFFIKNPHLMRPATLFGKRKFDGYRGEDERNPLAAVAGDVLAEQARNNEIAADLMAREKGSGDEVGV